MSVAEERPIVFQCDGEDLIGILHPGGEPLGVLIVVGGPQYRVGSHRQFTIMARAIAAAGYPVLRFDYRGMGDSSGAARTFDAVSEDVVAATDAFCREVPALRRVVLWGLCDGASAILIGPAADARVAGLILVNPWVRTVAGEAQTYLKHYYGRRLLQRDFWAKLASGGFNPLSSLKSLLRNIRHSSTGAPKQPGGAGELFLERMLGGLERFDGRVLVLLSGRDFTAQEFSELCGKDARWRRALNRRSARVVNLPGADHTFSDRVELDAAVAECRRALSQWRSTSD